MKSVFCVRLLLICADWNRSFICAREQKVISLTFGLLVRRTPYLYLQKDSDSICNQPRLHSQVKNRTHPYFVHLYLQFSHSSECETFVTTTATILSCLSPLHHFPPRLPPLHHLRQSIYPLHLCWLCPSCRSLDSRPPHCNRHTSNHPE